MNILGIIPARYASTRFPGKPLAPIHGKPMIQHVYEQAVKAFPLIYIATDDNRIEDAVKAFGGNVIITSPDHCSGTDRCAEAAAAIQKKYNQPFDIVVNIQGDEPFIVPEQLLQMVACFNSPDTQIATLVKPFAPTDDIFNPNTPKVVRRQCGEAIYFSRSPIPFLRNVPREKWAEKFTFYKHIGLYAYRYEVLLQLSRLQPTLLELAESLEQLRWLESGFTIQTAVTHYESHAVDTPDDLHKLLNLL